MTFSPTSAISDEMRGVVESERVAGEQTLRVRIAVTQNDH